MSYSFDRMAQRDPDLLNKWSTYPQDVLPMWVADMDFRAPLPLLEALQKAIRHGALGYESASPALYRTVAGRMHKLYDWDVDPESVVAVTGVVSGFNVAARTFCTEKRGYLIQPPVYSEFHAVKGNLDLAQREAPLIQSARGNILHYEIDWEAFSRQVKKARVFLLCNPHNPVGLIFSRRDLRRMAEICLEQNVLIVSDEIHSELLLGGAQFQPLATLSKEIAQQTITLVSPSKTFNIAGLFCGFAIIPNPELRAKYCEAVSRLRLHVSNLGLFAARTAFSGECDDWLKELLVYLTANRDYLVDYVTDFLPDAYITRPAATYLAWLDCTELVGQGLIEGSPFDFFKREAKVAFGDGKAYGKQSSKYIRINFGCTRRTLKKALNRVQETLYWRKHG